MNFWNRESSRDNYYLDYYSGSTEKQIQTALKNAEADLEKAKTPAQKLRIEQRIRGIMNRRGVLAAAKEKK